MTDTTEHFFSFHQTPNPPVENTEDFFSMAEIVIKVEKDHYRVSRSVFTFWTLLSEYGGLQGILISIFGGISLMFSYNMPENMVADKLYRKKQKYSPRNSESAQLPTENAFLVYFADCC